MSLLELNAIFDTAEDLKNKIRDAAVEGRFQYRVVYSEPRRYTVACVNSEDGCPWRLHATKLNDTMLFKIIKYDPVHSCIGNNSLQNGSASSKWIAGEILDRLRDIPTYKPNEVRKDLIRNRGVAVPYLKAYRGKEDAKRLLGDNHEAAYAFMPLYCEKLRDSNPGSTAFVDSHAEHFTRVFVALSATVEGFKHCRPLVGLDGTHLKGKYRGIMLSATAIDAQGKLFPLMFAVVNAENELNWNWFLYHLKRCLEEKDDFRRLTFLSDRQKGLIKAVSSVFPLQKERFVDHYLKVEEYQQSYAETVHPIPSKSEWEHELQSTHSLLPPIVKRLPGRPRKMRTKTENLRERKRVHKCSSCGNPGHSKRTCAQPL